jgi:ABC-2 type transport system ATP-binding protein
MINHGRVVAAEAPKTLARLVSRHERIRVRADDGLLERVAALPGVTGVDRGEDGYARVSVADQESVGRVLAFVVAAGITDVGTELPGLEEVYLRLVHRGEERSEVRG